MKYHCKGAFVTAQQDLIRFNVTVDDPSSDAIYRKAIDEGIIEWQWDYPIYKFECIPDSDCETIADIRGKMLTRNEINRFISILEDYNPYPEEIFTPPTQEELKKAAPALENAGLIPDRIFAWCGRFVWEGAIAKIKEELENLLEEENE